MDSITQAALGAAIGEATLGKHIGNKGAVLGAIVATIPDLDVAFYLFYDKFEMLSIHRGFSHSIVFSIIGEFIITYVLQRIKWTKTVSYQRLWLFTCLTLLTHMLLDTFTAYGTQLFLPVYNQIGIAVSTFYLLGTLGVKNQVEEHFKTALAKQNITYHSLLTMPIGIANVNWYGVAKTSEGLYMQKYSVLNNDQLSFEYFPSNDYLLEGINPTLVDRMKWFAKGFYTVEKEGNKLRFYNLQVDMRGIIRNDGIKAPTAGYFVITPKENGDFEFSSGTHTNIK